MQPNFGSSSAPSKKLTQEEKLRIWQDAKRNRQRSTTYSKNSHSFREQLRVYDSPKPLTKCKSQGKKEFTKANSANDSLNSSKQSIPSQSNENSMGKTTPFFEVINLQTPRFSPKCLSTIEENSPNEKNNTPQKKGEENEGNEEFLGHQLKKILTEDKQLQSYQNRCDSFSFQGKLSKSSNSSKDDAMGVVVEIAKENEETNISNNLPFEIKGKTIEEKNEEQSKVNQETKINDERNIDGIKVKKTNKNEKKEIMSEKKEAKTSKTPKKKRTDYEIFKSEQKVDDATYFYGYSQKKAMKPIVEQFNVEKVIAPVKISNRRSQTNSFSISLKLKKIKNFIIFLKVKKEDIEDVSKVLYEPNDMIEEKYKPIDEDCLLLKQFLKENAVIKNQNEKHVGTEEKITKPEEISQVIDPNINQNGNYALLELTNEKAEKLKLGTRKVITPLKKFSNEEILNGSERRKEDILKASKGKKEKDFGYIPFNEKLPQILEKFEKKP